MSTSTGCRLMTPLNASCHTCPPPEDLQPSEGKPSYALRKKQNKGFIWYLASWNVRSLLDREGSIETARQGCEGSIKL